MTQPVFSRPAPNDSELIWSDTLPPASHWSLYMEKDHVLRLIDLEGGANLGMLLYNPLNLLERYNMPDTLKGQHTFFLTEGHCLYSDMGRIFCSVVTDTAGWHDTVAGDTDRELVKQKWDGGNFQEARNDRVQNGRDSFLVELGKYGLGKRDLAANVNWFSKVAVDDAGTMSYVPGHSGPGSYVDLRFEMTSLVVMHSCPHPLNPAPVYPRFPVGYELYRVPPAGAEDPCRLSRPENERAFANTALFHLQRPLPEAAHD